MNYTTLADKKSLDKTILSLSGKGYKVFNTQSSSEALEKIKEIIPEGSVLMNGSSTTLNQIGFSDLLKDNNHKWNNLHEAIVSETDTEKQSILRKEATLSEYYIGSVHAITEDGEMVIASNTGSQLPNIVFSSTNLVFIIGTQKIVNNLSSAMERLENHVKALEDERSKVAYGVPTSVNKILIFKGENPYMGRTVSIILVNELLGY
jgi:L-lactate utilization protein LutC